MARFLIEVPHSSEVAACWRAIHALLATGSHYITHADWGCRDGEHKAWLTVDVDDKDDALRIVPPSFRSEAKVVQLCKFSLEEAEEMVREHWGGDRPNGTLRVAKASPALFGEVRLEDLAQVKDAAL